MNNKSKKISALYLVFMMAVGGVCGFLLTSESIPHPENLSFNPGIYYDYDLIFGVIGVACLVLTIWNIIGIMRYSSKPENELSDEGPTAGERAIGLLMKISAFNYISASLWFALCMAYFASREAQDKDQIVFLSVNLLCAVVFIVIAVLLQSIILRHYNKLYPDRSISMRSRNTQRELFDKLDEAERFTVYRSAYSSFKAVNVMIYCGILFFILYSFLFEFSPLPIIVLTVISIVQKAVYFREASKMGK